MKPKVTVYNKELHTTISKHIAAMHKAYEAMKKKRLDMTSAVFEEQINFILNPIVETRAKAGENVHDRFVRFALMNAAFEQEDYMVNENFEILR